ncbi:MAG TPA: histidine phosphatase family protein [Nocardioidaceae bacterium]|nr:histidine phosphatase family protein [Nocardioidaceae bacterium]
MSVILLVRHGQASFGEPDYDALSELGVRQSQILGRALAARGVEPDLLVTGRMKRHLQTLEHAAESARWDAPTEVDEGWNEFDHEQMIEVHEPAPRQAFEEMFEAATSRWAAGEHDHEYTESFTAFGQRVQEALRRTSSALEPKQTAVVFTSGGPISRVAASILSPSGACGTELWGQMNTTTINAAVTKVVVGARGHTVVSTNDHSHLEAAGLGLITYR